jgi:hypothetical protein
MSETGLQRWGRVTRGLLAVVAMAAAGLALAACSPGVEYPSLFPAIHDTPPPRADAPLDSLEIQRATEDLINARDHLTAEAQARAKAAPNPPPNPSVKSSAAAGVGVANPPAKSSSAAQEQAAATDRAQPAAPETKP